MPDVSDFAALAALQAIRHKGEFVDDGLIERVRSVAMALADVAEKQGGRKARLDVWTQLFCLGVFDRPPLSGAAYDAWRELAASSLISGGAGLKLEEGELTAPPSPSGPPPNPLLLSVLMPVYNPRPEQLAAAVESVLCQTWRQWELCIADDCSTDPKIGVMLRRFMERDARIKVTFRSENGHISAATNSALDMAEGEWCVLLDNDDKLEPQALAVVAATALRHADAMVLFSDEDQFFDESDGRGEQRERALNPMFKPDFDPDLFLACNMVSHLGVYRASLLRQIGGFRHGFEGSQDYDLALRCLAVVGANAFVHMPGVLYRWRRHETSVSSDWRVKPYVREAGVAARRDYAASAGLSVSFLPRPDSVYADVAFAPPHPAPLLSLCILADGELSPRAARQLKEGTTWSKKEILLAVRENACESRAVERLVAELHARVVPVPADADDWRFADAAASAARGGVLAFLRLGDVPINPNWAERAMGALCRPDVAVAGCRSLNANGFLQHAGYAVEHGDNLRLCPAYAGLHQLSGGYFGWAHLLHSALATRLSGFFCRRADYDAQGGFSALARNSDNALAEVDFCLRAREQTGRRTVIVPGADLLSSHSVPCCSVSGVFAEQWGELLRTAPPFQSPLLSWTPGGWKFRVFLQE